MSPASGGRPAKVQTLSNILVEHLDHVDDRQAEIDPEARVKKALLERPRFSVKSRLVLLFSIFFLVSTGTSLAAWVILSKIQSSTQIIAATEAATHEIEEARRYEKNFFLYGSDLGQVTQHIDKADRLLGQASSNTEWVAAGEQIRVVRESLVRYRSLIERFVSGEKEASFHDSPVFKQMESELRDLGSHMLDNAFAANATEREQILRSLAQAKRVFVIMLIVLLPLAIYIAAHIYRHIIARLTRLMAATQRMAEGDMSPILPVRRYQDEFSNLAIALNHMMYQLEKRQSILVESHKMRAVGNLTAGVAHELNNPLNNIMLTAEMLKEDWEKLSGEARFEMVDDLIQQADRARSVVKNLLDFARESETEVEHVGIGDLLDEVIRLAQNQIKISKIKLHVDVADHLPPVYGDRGLIVQVFLNLFLNAIDAMPNGGHLFVRANEEEDTGFLAVHVQDTGSGIPPLLLQSIFDPFFTTKPTGKGTGLGLAVSQGIVNQHGGDIEVMSKVGVGTTFTVHLPCVPVPAQLAKQPAALTSLTSPTPSTRVEEDPTAG